MTVLARETTSLPELERAMDKATRHAEWLALARSHDQLSGAQNWRETAATSLYDFNEIQGRCERLRKCLAEGAAQELLYALNEGVHGNMGGMGKPILYAQAKCGTKHVIEEYVSTITRALTYISHTPDAVIPRSEKIDFFRRASHCYGRSALLLSGGAGLIYFHHGVVQELVDQDLLPNVISGASAGSIVAAQVGIRTDAELKAGYFAKKRYEEPNRTRMLDVFTGKLDAQQAKIARERLLDEIIPKDITFQEAYERTGRYINISISPSEKHQSSRLMNAITSPQVYIRAAVSASSSIPGVIAAERLYAKGFDGKPRPYLAGRRWVDGSLSGDLPAKRLARLYGVNHFIVSLINPVVVPFVHDVTTKKSAGIRAALSVSALGVANELLTNIQNLLERRGNVGSRMAAQLAYLVGMLEQNYLGDINILMEKSDFKWRQTLFEFRDDEIERMIEAGMRRTWPKLTQIHNAALISQTLDRILEELGQDTSTPGARSKHHQYV